MNQIHISKDFLESEFADPSTGEAKVTPELVTAMQELRDRVGKPIKILSGYRSPAHNASVGGQQDSKHLLGLAADFTVPGMDLLLLLSHVINVQAFHDSGIGFYPQNNFIHADVGRGKPARWARINGVYVGMDQGIAEYKKIKGVVV